MKSSQLGLKILQNAAGANGDGQTYLLSGAEDIVLCVSGTFSADIHVEVTLDGITWHEVAVRDLTTSNSSDKVKTVKAPGLFAVEHCGGTLLLRARVAAWASGAVTVKVNAHG